MHDITKISQITDHIFLSGVFPIEENYGLIKKLDIKYILCCVDRTYLSEIHDQIMADNPDLTILYLPYNDNERQNLWTTNKNNIKLLKYISSTEDYNKLSNQISLYNNKPMIDIGYHFIDQAVSFGKNILVHCMAGMSRSVSLVVYYLMKKYHLTFQDAVSYVNSKRAIANPNSSFKWQLQSYQKKRDKFTESDANCIIAHLARG